MSVEMKDYYAARAKEYDKIYAKPERQQDLRAIEQWLPSKFAQCDVLEVAAGTGYWTQFIAPAARHVVALDASDETLSIAKTRPGVAAVDWVVGDAYDMSLGEQKFDAVFAGFWLSHIPLEKLPGYLSYLNGFLKPGARVIFLDNLYVQGNSTPLSERDAAGNTYQTRPLADGSIHKVLKNYPTELGLSDLVSSFSRQFSYTTWQYYWAFDYRVDG
ncbi:MAG: methyltransferase domain-containing protein [Burkholderiales bacterium]|nr:methyltransferase domain-containing protein [Burkholderiales bacterium]